MQRECLSQRSLRFRLFLNTILIKPGLERTFFEFLFGLGLVFFMNWLEMKTQIWVLPGKSFPIETFPYFHHLSLPLDALTKILIKSPLLKTEEQEICTVRECTYSFLPRFFWDVSQHTEPPFKGTFSLQGVLLMPGAALGTLIAKERRHIDNQCLHGAAFMTLISEHTQLFGRNHAHKVNSNAWVWS